MHTSQTITHAVGLYYTMTMLAVSNPLLVYASFAQVSETIPQGQSDTIKWRRWERLSPATTPLTEGVTPAGSNLSFTDITATVDWYGDFITNTDVLEYEVGEPRLTTVAERQGEQMANTIDQLTRDIVAATTTVQYASTAVSNITVTTAMTLNTAEVKEAELTLKNNDAQPIRSVVAATPNYDTYGIPACFVGVIAPNTTYDLENESATTSQWIPVQKYPSQSMVLSGEVGSIGKVRFIETTNAKVYTGAGATGQNVYGTVIFARDAFGTVQISSATAQQIIKPLGSGGANDPLNQRATQGWKLPFVAKILNDDFMVCIRHSCSQG